MNHQPYREWIELALYEELSNDERQSLDQHLQSCAECRTEFEQMHLLQTRVAQTRRLEVTDQLLKEAREEFRAALRKEYSKVSGWQQLMESFDNFVTPMVRVILGSTFMLAIGFFVGYMMFHSPETNGSIALSMSRGTELTRGESQINNIKFTDADPEDGEIEFSFDIIMPVHVKGSPSDPGIQRVLMNALAYEENPGVRLRAVSTITSPMVQIEFGMNDKEVKDALINAMKYDENPAVRKEALKALRRLPFDDDIKQALLHVLASDKNEAMRLNAINLLTASKDDVKSGDDKLLEILRKKAESETNNYIRQRARVVLQEVQQ